MPLEMGISISPFPLRPTKGTFHVTYTSRAKITHPMAHLCGAAWGRDTGPAHTSPLHLHTLAEDLKSLLGVWEISMSFP